MRRTASLAGSLSLARTLQNPTGGRLAGTGFTLIPGREAMCTRLGAMHLCLPLDVQSKEALADSTQMDCDWEKEWV
jgi:hypothetical protein